MTASAATEDLLPFRCQSRQCKEDMEDKGDVACVMFLPEDAACPVCKSKKYLFPLAVVHLLLPADEDDPAALQGRNGMWKIACGATQKEAKGLATERDVTDGDGYLVSPIVTCHRCRTLTESAQPRERVRVQV